MKGVQLQVAGLLVFLILFVGICFSNFSFAERQNEKNLYLNTGMLSVAMMGPCASEFSNIQESYTTLNECGDPGTFSFSADIGNLTDIQVLIELPGSFVFKGNLEGANLISTSPLIIEPVLESFAINFSFDLQAPCDSSDDGQIEFGFSYSGGGESCTHLSIPLTVDDITVLIASAGTPGRNTEDVLIAVLNEIDTLTTTIVQEGVGVIDSLFYFVDAHPLLSLEKVLHCDTGEELEIAYTDGDRIYYWVGINETGSDGFVRNEGIDICEVWKVIACPDGAIASINHGVSTSCDFDPINNTCDFGDGNAVLDFGARVPELTQYVNLDTDFNPFCPSESPKNQGWFLVNTGEAPVGGVEVAFSEFGGATPIDITSFTYIEGSGGASQSFVDDETDTDIIYVYDANLPACVTSLANSPDLKSRVTLKFSNLNIAAGDTLFINYDIYPARCGCSGCDVRRRYGVDIHDVNAFDLCDNLVQTEETRAHVAWPSFDINFSSFMESPVTNCYGSNSTLSTTVSNYTNDFLSNHGNNWQDDNERNELHALIGGQCTTCYFETLFELPNGLDYVPGTIFWQDDDGTQWIPDYIDYNDNDGGIDLLTVRWIGQEPAGFDAFSEASGIFFDYTPDCDNELDRGPNCSPVLYTDVISKTSSFNYQDCAGCASEIVECKEDLTVVIKCPGTGTDCDCAGFVQTYGDAERFNLYVSDPDNNGQPNEGSAYNESIIRRDRFVKGDSIKVDMGGYVHTNATHTSFDYIYALVDFPNPNFIPIGGQVEIYAADGSYYFCDVLTQQILPGDLLLTDLSLSRLSSNGCAVPSAFVDGDSIALSFTYRSTEDFMGEVQQLTHRTRIFTAHEPYGGQEYSCRLPFDYRLSQVGRQESFGFYTWRLNDFAGCETGTGYYRGYSRLGTANVDFFPGEYIGFIDHVSQFRSNIPSGMLFNFFRVYIRRKNASSANSMGGKINGLNHVDINATHPAITIVGNQLIFDFNTYIQNQYGGIIPPSDEGYSFSLEPYFIPTCDLETGPVEQQDIEVDHVTNPNIMCSSEYTDTGSRTNFNYSGGAKIIVEVVDECITVDKFPMCSKIRVRNDGVSVANNTWLTFKNNSGFIIFDELNSVSGSTITPVEGSEFNMFNLGNINGNSSRLYEICVYPNICEQDSLEVFSGYDCVTYPSILEEATCSSRGVINFKSTAGALSMIAKSPTDNLVLDDLCDTIEFVVDLSASGPGFLDDILLDINLPLDMEFIPGSFEIAFPTTASGTTLPPDSEYEPANDPIFLYGNTYQLNVTEEDDDMELQGLIGSDGSAFNLNVVNVRFKAETKCGYASGSRVFFESSASSGCGEKLLPTQKDFSAKVGIFDAPPPFISEISIQADTLEACVGEGTTLEVEYSINGTMSTSTQDSLRVILPPGVSFVPNSYVFGTNPNTNPPVIKNESGLQVLYWGIAGLTPGDAATFSIDIKAEDVGQGCQDFPLYVQTFKSAEAFCDATNETCNVRSISDESVEFIFIQKPELEVNSINVSAMTMGANEMLMFEFTVQNIGDVASTSDNIIYLDIFDDVDGDGRYTAGVDIILGTVSTAAAVGVGETAILTGDLIIPAGTSCQMVAYLDSSKNCSCSSSASAQIQSDLDLKIEKVFTACSNEAIQFGPDANPAYEFEWLSLLGSDLTAIQTPLNQTPATFSFDNNTGAEITWLYGLRVLRAPGCYTFDTIEVTIYPETTGVISTTVCGPIEDCGESEFSFPLAGPIAGSNYQWTVQSGDATAIIDMPTNPLTTVSSVISSNTTFKLDYLDENGCSASFLQNVMLQNCACTALGDTVWYDFNVDGIQDPGEPGIEGITVYLYDANDLTTPIATTFTDADGYYVFKPLPQGNYVVRFDKSSYTGIYNALEPTLHNVGSDVDDSDADPVTGFTGPYFVPNGISNWTIDAGFYPAFDLALTKDVNTTLSPGPYFPGDNIVYTITVENQGTYYEARNIEVTDYLPTNLSFISVTTGTLTTNLSNSASVTDLGGGQFEIDVLQPGDQVEIDITLQLSATAPLGPINNFAEISGFENDHDLDDSDSTADSDNSNDAGGNPGSASDNATNGDGTGTAGDSDKDTDEDDHDPAQVEIQSVDLALKKTYDNSFNPQPVPVGDLVKFDIEVINQGDVSVDSIRIVDYVPAGYSFDPLNPLNVVNGWNSAMETTVISTLNSGDRATVSIYLTVVYSSNPADYINASEITNAYDIVTGRDVAGFDIDSTPGSNTYQESETVPGSSGDNNIVSTGVNDTGSEDDHDIETIVMAHVDVALTKMIDPMYDLSNISFGDSIKYLITVINQGTIDGSGVEVYDYLPAGLSFDPTISGNSIWTVVDGSTVKTTVNNLVRTTQQELCLWLRIQDANGPDAWTNFSEISSFIDGDGQDRTDEDIDSDLNNDDSDNGGGEPNSDADDYVDGDGTGAVGDGTDSTDEDNSDPAFLPIFDLALEKNLLSMGPHAYGDTLTFEFEIYNQGNVTATNIEVTDSIPAGFFFDPTLNTSWDGASNPDLIYEITSNLLPNSSTTFQLRLVLQAGDGSLGAFTNIGEISDAQDTDGNHPRDIDSAPDDSASNDNGGEPNTSTDNQIDDHGDTDEDDHDPAIVEVFDLALVKTILTPAPYAYGDRITFQFEVLNQGNITATNVDVTEYTPCGYTYDIIDLTPTWIELDGNLVTTVAGPIAPGMSETVTLELELQQCNDAGSHNNFGEISKSYDDEGEETTDDDIDSTADDEDDNDGESKDDNTSNEDGDEDDHDGAQLPVFDLALKKELVTTGVAAYDDLLEFRIVVFNQGDITADEVVVNDSIPSGFSFDAATNPDWDATNAPDYTYTFTDPILAGESDTVTIFLTLVQSDGTLDAYTNIGEISDAQDTEGNHPDDIDSNPDDNTANDNGGDPNESTDDEINDHGDTDEDDQDPAIVDVFDLALVKTIVDGGPYNYGDPVTFKFEVFNQGNVTATNIDITEYTPCGYAYDLAALEPTWTLVNGNLTTTLAGPIAPGMSDFVTLEMTVIQCTENTSHANFGEISKAFDDEGEEKTDDDIDSNTDADEDNDGEVNDDNTSNEDGDEDDHDIAILPVFDLALKKELLTEAPFAFGDILEFRIIVINQGQIDAAEIVIHDSIPTGFLFEPARNPLWDATNAPDYTITISEPLLAGEHDTVSLFLELQQSDGSADAYTNIGEIRDAQDTEGNHPDDIDSNSDDNTSNDNGGEPNGPTDDETEDTGLVDEDDHDPAIVDVFDLAIKKTFVDPGPFSYGDTVTFKFEVFNQGNISATNIKIREFTPCGFTFDESLNAPTWYVLNGDLETVIPGPILAGERTSVNLDLVVIQCIESRAFENYGEIAQAFDDMGNDMSDEDIDSYPDIVETNDGETTNDELFNGNGDEDDLDMELLPVFDLAIQKTIDQTLPATIGSIHEFEITIFNQGSIPASNVLISDYIPPALQLAAGLNPDWTDVSPSLATYLESSVIPPLGQVTISIFLEVISNNPLDMVNMAEITMAQDDMMNDMTGSDADSVADGDNDNDNGNDPFGPLDDFLLNEDGDEDDHDQAFLVMCDGLVCNGNLNIGLDENCSLTISPEMFLKDDLIYPADFYEITITDAQGNIIPTTMFTVEDLGKTFFYSVSLALCDNNSCWGEIFIEDKFAPTIVCMDEDLACNALEDAMDPVIMDNCGADLILLSEVHENLFCDPNYTGRVTKTWQAVDAYGNVSNVCTQVINLERINLGSVIFPVSTSINLSCDDAYATDANGHPDPSVTGVPMYLGNPLYPMVSGNFCNGFASYTDEVLVNSSCHTQILREWQVGEWYCSGIVGPMIWMQIIDIKDLVGPTINCPANVTLSTSNGFNNCEGTVNLPSATVSDNCSNPIEVDVTYPGGFNDNENGGTATLPVGDHLITYTAYDACGNSNSCTMTLTIADETQPIAICEGNTIVSIKQNGTAVASADSFDDGSYDNCGIDRFEVRRMTDACGVVGNSVLGQSVTFCCLDVGTEQMLQLRVYDAAGNYTDCMITVEVQDKLEPVLTCPGNMTVPCTTNYDLNNLDATFEAAIVSDNCQTIQEVMEVTTEDFDQCGTGALTREFSIVSHSGLTQTCTQVISFANNTPIVASDITWPADYEGEGCGVTDILPADLPEINSEPIINDGPCDLVAFNYVDDVFNFVQGDNACFKIVRTWTVIDWCQPIAGGFAEWTHEQVIKVNETSLPEITSDLSTVNVETLDAECIDGQLNLTATGTDACTSANDLEWSYEIDSNNDGVADYAGTGNDVSGQYPIGNYEITWKLTDGCGNYTEATQLFNIVNVKPPTAVCINGLSTQLVGMDTDGNGELDTEMVVLSPSYFDGGSGHVCGYPVTLSFDAEGLVTELIYDCDDIGIQSVALYVTDINGNQSFCETFIEVIDDNNVSLCNTGGLVSIEGQIANQYEEYVEEVMVNLTGDANLQDMTEEEGEYGFGEMAMDGNYVVVPEKNDDVMNGVSTLDLVLIQKHILGLQSLNNPYDLIAADINRSEEITALDLIELRKVILGVYEEFPNNTSWRFIDGLHSFSDPENPWLELLPEEYEITDLSEDMEINFVGVKTGDVNGSVETNVQGENTEQRNREEYVFEIPTRVQVVQGQKLIPVYGTEETSLDGFQMSLNMDNISAFKGLASGTINVNESNFYVHPDRVNIVWHSLNGMTQHVLSRDTPLFYLIVKQDEGFISRNIKLSRKDFENETYTNQGIQNITLNYRDELSESTGFSVSQNIPNPWNEKTMIQLSMNTSENVILKIYDVTGKLLESKTFRFEPGIHELIITDEYLITNGVYTYEIQIGEKIVQKKMILMK